MNRLTICRFRVFRRRYGTNLERLESGGFTPLRRYLDFAENTKNPVSVKILKQRERKAIEREILELECGNRELRQWLVGDCGGEYADLKIEKRI